MDQLDQVRTELAARIIAIDWRGGRQRHRRLAGEIDAIRLIAHRAGLNPAVTVAHFLDSALARGERGSVIGDGLAMLADAVRCERQDLIACEAYAAACSVRLAS